MSITFIVVIYRWLVHSFVLEYLLDTHFVVLSKGRKRVLLPLSSQPCLETYKSEFLSKHEPGTYKFEKI